MTFEPHVFVLPWDVVWYWGCVQDAERRASSSVADALGLLLPGSYADVVDLIFQIASPLWWEKRLAVWRACWSIIEDTVTIGEDEIRIYRTDADWWINLFACQLSGGCGYGDVPCPARPPFVGYPA